MRRMSPLSCLAATILVYFALWWIIPRATFLPALVNAIDGLIPFVPRYAADGLRLVGVAVMMAPTVAFMAVQIAIVYSFARIRMSFWQAAGVLAALMFALAVVAFVIVTDSGVATKMARRLNPAETMFVLARFPHVLKMPMAVLVMLAAGSIGYLVSLRIKDRNLLVPVVMFAAYIDFWTVTRGPVSAVLKKAPQVAEAVSAPIPKIGTGAFVPVSYIGPGDFLFMTLVFAVVHRLDMGSRRNYWWIFGAMTAGMLSVLVGLVDTLPALMVLAAAVVAANWRGFKLSRQEAAAIGVVAVLLASLPLVWTLLSHSR